MDDCKGRPVQVGDTVLVPCEVYSTDEHGNLWLRTVASLFPDTETVLTAKTTQVIRANAGDDTEYEVVPKGDGTKSIRGPHRRQAKPTS